MYRVFCIMYNILQYLKNKKGNKTKYYGCANLIAGIDIIPYDRQLIERNINFCRQVMRMNHDFCFNKQHILKSSFDEDISYMLYNMIFHLYIDHYNYFILLFVMFPHITKLNDRVIEDNLMILKMKYQLQGDIYEFMHETTSIDNKIIYDLDDIEKLLIQRFIEFLRLL